MSTNDVTRKASLDAKELVAEGLKIVDLANGMGLTLRLSGGVAIFYLVENESALRQLIIENRKAGSSQSTFADLDFVGYSKQTKLMNELFLAKLLFQRDKIINALFGDRRRIYYHPQGAYHVDVLLDILEFNHDVDIRGRLEAQYPNLNRSDLLLTKLQIHFINEKDLLDIMALLALNPPFAETELHRICQPLSDDWGFYYDAVINLKLAMKLAYDILSRPNSAPQLKTSIERLESLICTIENAPKSKRWQKRAKQGPSKAWWREIEDVLR